jgi:molybdate transport system ATP-binding protein
MSKTFLSLQNVTFTKSNQLTFKNLNFQIRHGEQWAILGEIGSGKSSFLECLAGKHFIQEGSIDYHFDRKEIALVSFQEQSKLLDYKELYYQQRYYTSQSEGIITAKEFLYQSLFQQIDSKQLEKITTLLDLAEVLSLEMIKLSNGQKRKLLIAKALLKKPQLLLLDNPYIGLDAPTRQLMNEIINDLIDSGLHIVLVTHKDDIPSKITHWALMKDCQISVLHSLEEYRDNNPSEEEKNFETHSFSDVYDFKYAIKMNKVCINYGAKTVLKNISWEVKKGEKWAVMGNNGSGKSTLLSLIYADHPQSYANDIWLFDYPRGSGETIWDIKKMIGFVSPELHFYLQQSMTAFEIIATGFFDGFVVHRELIEREVDSIYNFLDYYQINHLADKDFMRLSTGEQRIVLLIRALIKKPALLIMDEPFQNLDRKYIALSLKLLDQYLTKEDTLIYVSHYKEEIPQCVTQFLYLSENFLNLG